MLGIGADVVGHHDRHVVMVPGMVQTVQELEFSQFLVGFLKYLVGSTDHAPKECHQADIHKDSDQ